MKSIGRWTREQSLSDQVDPVAEAAAYARADADVKAGRLIGYEAVKRRIPSWDSDKPLPCPEVDK